MTIKEENPTDWKVSFPLTAIVYETSKLTHLKINISLSTNLQLPPQPNEIPVTLKVTRIEEINEDLVEVKGEVLIPPPASGISTLKVHQPHPTTIYLQDPDSDSFYSIVYHITGFFLQQDLGGSIKPPDGNISLSLYPTGKYGVVEIGFNSDYITVPPETPKVITNFVKNTIKQLIENRWRYKLYTVTTVGDTPLPKEVNIQISLTGIEMHRNYLRPTVYLASFHIPLGKNLTQRVTDEKFILTWLMVKEPEILEGILNFLPPEVSLSDIKFSVEVNEDL